jgi:hypothetical protein
LQTIQKLKNQKSNKVKILHEDKKQAFDIPFIGYDYGKDYGWDFDVLFGQYGNPIIGIKIKNIVEQYSADPDNYLHFHTVLNQVVSIIGEEGLFRNSIFFQKRDTRQNHPTSFYNKNIPNTLTADCSKPLKPFCFYRYC